GRHQLLVGGDDGLSRIQSTEDERPGRLHASHELDDQSDVGVVDDVLGAVGGITGRERALLFEVTHRDLDQLQVQSGLGGDHVALGEELVSEASADDAATEDSDSYAHGGKTV